MNNNNITIIGIAGGTCSGKTYITNQLIDYFGENNISVIRLDSYYFDLSHLSMIDREKTNFDHPSSLDFQLLKNHILKFKNNINITIPIYNYKKHIRTKKYRKLSKTKVLIIEGILTLYNQEIRDLISLKVFLDIPSKTRKDLRLKRDVLERARNNNSILKQYNKTVKPMYSKFVYPTKVYANIIIKEDSVYNNAFNILSKQIKLILNDNEDKK